MILESLANDSHYIGLDRDREALARARARLARFGERVTFVHSDFRDLASVLQQLGAAQVNGVLLDLGLSSDQLASNRGFSYQTDSPLDLRFDPTTGTTASEWLNRAGLDDIIAAIRDFGEERHAKKLARLIVTERDRLPGGFRTTGQLSALIRKVTGPRGAEFGRSAARVFQALRIIVNDELAAIPIALNATVDHLTEGGRLVVIAYHSLEDRIVKDFMREASRECTCPKSYPRCLCGANPRGILVHRRAIRPLENEIKSNPRAKAAKMRVFQRQSRPGGRR